MARVMVKAGCSAAFGAAVGFVLSRLGVPTIAAVVAGLVAAVAVALVVVFVWAMLDPR